jgi:uncharacterized protein involved in copper resistance
MAQCEGTTSSGEQCKLEAQEDSRFCHLHGETTEMDPEETAEMAEETIEAEEDDATTADGEEAAAEGDDEAETAEEALSWDDVAHLALAGAVVLGMFFVVKTFGKWMPKI